MTDEEWADFPIPEAKTRYTLQCRRWLPMDSAPKDGTRVLLRDSDRVVWIGQWCKEKVWGTDQYDWHDDSGKWLEPDAWMPLPLP